MVTGQARGRLFGPSEARPGLEKGEGPPNYWYIPKICKSWMRHGELFLSWISVLGSKAAFQEGGFAADAPMGWRVYQTIHDFENVVDSPCAADNAELEKEWRAWLAELFAAPAACGFARHHDDYWNWLWTIESESNTAPFGGFWPRGVGKTRARSSGRRPWECEASAATFCTSGARRIVLTTRSRISAVSSSRRLLRDVIRGTPSHAPTSSATGAAGGATGLGPPTASRWTPRAST